MSDAIILVMIALAITAMLVVIPTLMGVIDLCSQIGGLVIACFTFAGALIGLIIGVPSKKREPGNGSS